MGVAKKTRKFGQVKRVIGLRDARLKENKAKTELALKQAAAKKTVNGELVREAPQMPSNMFFEHNTALVPPYNVLVDTNFLSHTVQRKLSLIDSMMDCLYAKCNPIITSCVMAELEKLGPKYRLALRVARDERWERLECDHKGVYADDCLVDRVQKNRIYIVGTNDKALKQRLRKIPGVPIMSVARANRRQLGHFTIVSGDLIFVRSQVGDVQVEPDAMEQDSSPNDISPASGPDRHKRSRIVLSCAPCRASKLKCDRDMPCGQCAKKGRVELCQYAPKPEKKRPAKGMSARLRRLEGIVREMIDVETAAGSKAGARDDGSAAGPVVQGHVVRGENATTYVGATHCMAMLEDVSVRKLLGELLIAVGVSRWLIPFKIEDLKSYFDQPDELNDGEMGESDSADLLLFSRTGPRNRQDLMNYLPDRQVADRILMRYFASMSPSQHILHRPTFTRAYAKFWQNPDDASLHWIAQLFMMLSLGVFFNHYINPSEVEGDSPMPTQDRVKLYKTCAGWALLWGKYTQPTITTLPAFLLFVESDFIFNRAGQMNCYILSGVCVRLMLKMGLHRDPSKLANITPFEGEMRRRMWNMALQVELLVSFHMGLPSLLQGIETDTTVPRNLQDEDFDEDSTDLPPGRPPSDYTAMTYPIHKTKILRVFGQIARQAHALTPPNYVEVMKLDKLLQEVWQEVPAFMRVRPLEECIGDPPMLLIQRFGLAAIYNKSRCVLHRRYLAEAVPKPEHDYSRKQCLEGAMTLLTYQHTIWDACKPGHALSQNGWFVSSLAVHDYLLAAMVVYLVIRNDHYSETGGEFDWMAQSTPTPTKAELTDLIKRSHFIWAEVATGEAEVRKTADTLATMLAKLGCPIDGPARMPGTAPQLRPNSIGNESSSLGAPSMDPSPMGTFGNDADLLSTIGLSKNKKVSAQIVARNADTMTASTSGSGSGPTPLSLGPSADATTGMNFPGMEATAGGLPEGLNFDTSWMQGTPDNMDWRYLDISLAHSHDAGRNEDTGQTWMERPPPLEQLEMVGSGGWNQGPQSLGNKELGR
ncbi:hypothetical protein B0T10DRAFT_457916 [Thelonectria olida]|uniref:Zn(2)-C6 fungal-type domain-containing protein n=1 Tax=Thelonectria olida TaxID=1576542 RepID=A0A9P9AU36_9HYPO|nr:hypothetical protein B0T10DRAFT_457916 [Thelonectria olida]